MEAVMQRQVKDAHMMAIILLANGIAYMQV